MLGRRDSGDNRDPGRRGGAAEPRCDTGVQREEGENRRGRQWGGDDNRSRGDHRAPGERCGVMPPGGAKEIGAGGVGGGGGKGDGTGAGNGSSGTFTKCPREAGEAVAAAAEERGGPGRARPALPSPARPVAAPPRPAQPCPPLQAARHRHRHRAPLYRLGPRGWGAAAAPAPRGRLPPKSRRRDARRAEARPALPGAAAARPAMPPRGPFARAPAPRSRCSSSHRCRRRYRSPPPRPRL